MKKHRINRLIRILLPAILLMAFAERAQAAAILLNNISVVVDQLNLTASVSAELQPFSNDGNDLFLEGISVNVNGPGGFQLDDSPFFLGLPAFVPGNGAPIFSQLFVLSGLLPATTYSGLFAITFIGDGASGSVLGNFSFATQAPASVPEAGTLLLVATGCAVLYRQRRNRSATVDL
jgi:hypothetical protein